MKTCPYCASPVEREKNHYYCDFCCLNITPNQVQEDGNRSIISFSDNSSENALNKTTPELMTLETIELLHLLRIARKERKSAYTQLTQIDRTEDNKTAVEHAHQDYQYFSKKTYVLENLLRQRFGYIPEKLDDQCFKEFHKLIANKKNTAKMRVYSD
ncbi:hypothetical protein [Bacillus sp. MSP13]|uniref:hypothetical protein n=1 Tax=Bacillus sp. MSP13 TaxID=1071061 RepID=UPI00057C247A|nr:hypothetical protein [Bacillus sp. MSP13]